MATQTQTVIIDFQSDFSSLQDGVDTLEKLGKVDAELAAQFRKTNTEINKQGQALKTTSLAGQQNFTKLSDLMKQFPKTGMNRFLLQVGKELTDAGVKADQFFNKTTTGAKATTTQFTSLRQELKLVKEQMQQAALTSGVLSDEYKKLKQRAGELDDTIKDVNSDIANAGSDTRGIDNVVGAVTTLAGGFSAVQGAAALFGDESEDVQKALLKVNAAMALATGIQQVSIALQKEGALARLADASATGVQIAIQKIYTFVTGRATAATVAFKIALAATGIGAAIVLVIALANAFKRSNEDLEDATAAVERHNAVLERMNLLLSQTLSIDLARAQALGKAESDLIRIRGNSLLRQREAIVQSNKELASQRDALDGTSEAYGKLNAAIDVNNDKLKEVDTQLIVENFNLQKSLADEQKQRIEDQKTLNDKAIAAAKKLRQQRVEDAKAAAEIRLLNTKDGSEEQLEAQKKLLGAELDLAMNNEELTRHQKILLAEQYFRDYEQLNKDFQARNAQIELDVLSRSLLNRNISNENAALLQEAFIRKTAEIEIQAAEGNSEKIKLIAAKRDQDIADAHIAAIRKSAEQEAQLTAATGGAGRRALESVAANEKLKQDVRINAINQLFQIEVSAIGRQIKANRDAAKIQGADQKALEIEYEQLLDQKANATEIAEGKITDLIKSENAKRQASDIAYIQATIGGLQQLSEIVAGIQSNQQQATQQAIDLRKREVEELLEAGAITEKEARESRRRIEAEERQAKNRAAQQQKNLAVFQALLSIPQAYIAGLTAPFPVGGPLYGAILAGIAGVQAGIIASRPVPRFASGKKGSYEGPAIAGEAGYELIERADGSMEVAANRQLVYLGSRDKVYTHAETKNIMPFVNKEAMKPVNGKEFDYSKLAKAFGNGKGGGVNINIDKDFISESVADGLSRVNYFNRYYSSK